MTETEFIRDPVGEDFVDRQVAEQEAAQVARDFMAEALREGKPLPLRWKVLLTSADDTVLVSLPFSRVVSDHEPLRVRPRPAKSTLPAPPAPVRSGDARQLIGDLQDAIRHCHEHREVVRAGIMEARQNLRELARLLRVLPDGHGQTEMMETQD